MAMTLPSNSTSVPVDSGAQLELVSDDHLEQAMIHRSLDIKKIPLDFVRRCPELVESSVALGFPGYLLTLKRISDILLSLGLGVIALFFLPFIALAIKCDSKGPVFYRQTRLGLHEKPFELIKFRSMRIDAEAGGAFFASEGDPRITPVGNFLRRTRLDELPQLWNVFRGEMTFIGPRPERPEHMAMILDEIPEFWMRTCVKPGLTGWAQTHYRYAGTIEQLNEKLEFDLFYIRFPSVWRELKVFLVTVRMMFGFHGQ